MGTDEKLIRRFLKQPKDFTFDEMKDCLHYSAISLTTEERLQVRG